MDESTKILEEEQNGAAMVAALASFVLLRWYEGSMPIDLEIMRDMSNNVSKLANAITNNNQVTLASNLSNECMKMMQYGYTIKDIHRLFIYLNADDIRTRGFLGADDASPTS
ncbi:hypothetical protein J5N97_020247 [Dioscorea zingiberensis]|uniref:Uncharacterized protein n=1 Tax=Dioscorea zingiberensis TaxID=325984 RepID=A0A9D5HDM3_9LILI|nr:hypothetical protein J5N97_020247 [Dioscorea zingiberensis]